MALVEKNNILKDSKFFSENKDYNLENKLLSEGKIDKEFLEKINFLKLEELITLKLLSSSRSLGGKLYNFPLLKFTTDVCREAILKYAFSVSKNRREASLILGLKKAEIINYIKKHNLKEEFQNESKSKKNS